jgi:hypothetical protein
MIKKILDKGTLIAITGSVDDMPKGNNFITDNDLPMQVGIMHADKTDSYKNHIHKVRNHQYTSISMEYHIIIRGKVRLSLFNDDKTLIKKIILKPNMFSLLVHGGHGYEVLEDDTVMVECKLGNFEGVESDKVRF